MHCGRIFEVLKSDLTQNNLRHFDPPAGDNEQKDFVIVNSGNATLAISAIQVTGDFAIPGVLPTTINAGEDDTISIQFSPTALGLRSGTLTILSNAAPFTINLSGTGETEIEVYNVVTTNPNGKHDFLKIRNIEFFPNNTVSIFDRWGNKVFEVNKYDNLTKVFKGTGDNGKDLPEGTCYYVIDKQSGGKPFTGFILLRR